MSDIMKDMREAMKGLRRHYEGKATLRTHQVPRTRPISMPPKRVHRIREAAGMSQEVFSRCLHISPRTLEKWEQGSSHPTGAGAALLTLIERHPEMALELAQA